MPPPKMLTVCWARHGQGSQAGPQAGELGSPGLPCCPHRVLPLGFAAGMQPEGFPVPGSRGGVQEDFPGELTTRGDPAAPGGGPGEGRLRNVNRQDPKLATQMFGSL